jgi:hypothetical protein
MSASATTRNPPNRPAPPRVTGNGECTGDGIGPTMEYPLKSGVKSALAAGYPRLLAPESPCGSIGPNLMSITARTLPRLWVIIPVIACGFLVWTALARLRRVDYISGLEGRARAVDAVDARSPTGYANAQRELIIPERNEESFNLIAQTQQMFALHELRVHHVDTENAPVGRAVTATSPYRWWLGLVAWLDHEVTGRPIGLSVERAALYSDPVLQILFLIGATLFTAWQLGGLAAAVLSVGVAVFYPFATGFLPGMPDPRGLSTLLALASVLVLMAGMKAPVGRRHQGAWFALAGAVGGFGMWVNVQMQAPIMIGIAIGALISACFGRADPVLGGAPPWRAWGLAGGICVLAACVAEYFPSDFDSMALDTVHPAYGIALIGTGELLEIAVPWILGRKPTWNARWLILTLVSFAAVAGVPFVLWKAGSRGFLTRDALWPSLSRLPNSPVAEGTRSWLGRDGFTSTAWATFLPVLTVLPALWLLLRRGSATQARESVALALGPAIVAACLAYGQLGWWSAFGGVVIVLKVATWSDPDPTARLPRWIALALVLGAAGFGATRLLPSVASAALTPREGEELIDRHLAHWLSERTGHTRAIVYAPPNETLGLWFYGDLRGIGTFSPDNRTGFGAALNIAAAPNMEEVQNDLRALGVRYVVLPSWDPFFDDFARLYLDKRFADRKSLLAANLRHFDLPPWLRPVPYQMPVGGGFEGQSVLVFEVVDEQAPAAAAGRLAEYLVETGDLVKAAAVADGLRRFPGDVGALAARAQVSGARGDAEGTASVLKTLLVRLASGGDRYLPWDRRVSVAIVLAQGDRPDLARDQVHRCIVDLTEERLRSLSTGSLYALLVMAHSFGFEIIDPRLRELAPELLPDALRSRI